MKNKGYRGVIGWTVLLLLFFMQASYGQDTGDFSVSGTGTSSFADNVLTVFDGEVTVSTSGETSNTIKLTGGKLILNGVNIEVTSGSVSPIEVEGTAEINLADGSTNTMTSTVDAAAGIHVPSGSTVTFTGSGALTAKNTRASVFYSSSCGIGGKQGTYSCGTIIFDLDGTVTAIGGDRGAGIGTCMREGGRALVSGFIRIKKGVINATGGNHAAGIGTGPDGGTGGEVTVVIEGGTVTTGTDSGGTKTGIGMGKNNKTKVDIVLLGGNVIANLASRGISFNILIVGPDVTVDGEITENYTNGFVFSGTPNKSATVKGNPIFPVDKELTIDAGETLTVPDGTTLTNNGAITNNGTITKSGTISGDGAFAGTKPDGWTGNVAYITYDANGSCVTIADTYHTQGEISSFPEISGMYRVGYTCIGWNTETDATEPLATYTVVAGANTLYAVWKANELNLSSDSKEITGKVGEAFAKVDLYDNVSQKEAVGDMIFAVKAGNSLPSGFNLAEDGRLTAPSCPAEVISSYKVTITVTPKNGAPAKDLTLTFNIEKGASTISFNGGGNYSKTYGENAVEVKTTQTGSTKPAVITYYTDNNRTENPTTSQPTDAGTYYLKATLEGDDNYESASAANTTLTIHKKDLVITPDDNQFVYDDEKGTYAPTYTFSGALADQVPAFSDKLGWEDGTGEKNITLGTLKLEDNGSFKAANYELELALSSITINVLPQSLTDAYTTAAGEIAAEVTTGWHNSSISLTAPTDFKLKVVTDLRAAEDWRDELVISKEGKYDFKYQLLRDGREESSASAEQTLSIQLDQTAPAIKDAPDISGLTAAFTLADAVSGIASYGYTLDEGAPVSVVSVADNPGELPVVVSAVAGSHSIVFTIKDVAGNEATTASVSFTLTDPAPPVTPPVTPPDDTEPTYYTVTLPEVEGATTDPTAGDYDVESYSSFRFRLTLAEGYANNSKPVVTTNRGETIEPRSSDGAYLIKYVRQDIVISISGIVPDIPTGITGLDAETRIRVANGTLLISVPQTADAFITDTSGRILRTLRLVPGTTRVEGLHSGIYIVKIAGQEGRKVIVN